MQPTSAALLDAAAAADMLAWENSGFSVDASVRIMLIDRDVPRYFRSLERLLRYCARPPFALATSASSVMRRSLTLSLWERAGVRVPRTTQNPARMTRHGLPGPSSWPGWGRSFRSSARTAAATSG
jgi:hypothetical protein